MTDTPDYPTVARYLAGECAGEERQRVEAWAGASLENRQTLESLRAIYTHSDRPHRLFDTDRGWQQVDARTAMSPVVGVAGPRVAGPRVAGPRVAQRKATRWLPLGLLSGAALATGLLVLVWMPGRSPAMHAYATLDGQRETMTLADGTRIILAPASTIEVPADYASGHHVVRLKGEAFFTVVHDTAHPFRVVANGVTTRDVGTQFDIRAYGDDRDVRVAVTEGTVAVGTASLHSGDVASVGAAGVVVTHGTNVFALTAWTQGRLVFEDVPLQVVARDLARALDITITIADTTLERRRITASFDGESISQVLDDITGIVGARYERNGRRVVIKPRAAALLDHAPAPQAPLTTVQAESTHK